MLRYPTLTTLSAKDLLRELKATGRFNAVRLKDVENAVTWATFNIMWNSRRCAGFRADYDVAGFVAWFVATLGQRRYCLSDSGGRCLSDRLARHVRRVGVAPAPKQLRAMAARDETERAVGDLVTSAEHVRLEDGSRRILLDASIVLGDLLASKATFVMFSFEETTVTMARQKLARVASAMRAFPDVRCYLHLDAANPQLRFWWRGGAGGLHLNHSFSYVEWNMRVHAAETTAVVFPVPEHVAMPGSPAVPAVEIAAEPVIMANDPQPVAAPIAEQAPDAPPASVKRLRRACAVCSHAERETIDKRLATGARPLEATAGLGFDSYTARVHARDHLRAEQAASRRAASSRRVA